MQLTAAEPTSPIAFASPSSSAIILDIHESLFAPPASSFRSSHPFAGEPTMFEVSPLLGRRISARQSKSRPELRVVTSPSNILTSVPKADLSPTLGYFEGYGSHRREVSTSSTLTHKGNAYTPSMTTPPFLHHRQHPKPVSSHRRSDGLPSLHLSSTNSSKEDLDSYLPPTPPAVQPHLLLHTTASSSAYPDVFLESDVSETSSPVDVPVRTTLNALRHVKSLRFNRSRTLSEASVRSQSGGRSLSNEMFAAPSLLSPPPPPLPLPRSFSARMTQLFKPGSAVRREASVVPTRSGPALVFA